MIKAVLFDMDGVLVDSEPEYKRIEAQIAKSVGIEFTQEDLQSSLGKSQLQTWKEFKEKYGFREDPEELVEREARMIRSFYEENPIPIEPAVRLLKRCRESGLKTAIATSSLEENALLAVKNLGLEEYVCAVAGGDKVKNSKPAPDIFLLATRLLGVSPAECAVIEDSANGVAAAKAAGMKAVGVDSNEIPQDFSAADMTVRSAAELDVETLRSLF